MDEFGLVWLSSVCYGCVWFGVVEFEFGLVWLIFALFIDDLNKNAILDAWMEVN